MHKEAEIFTSREIAIFIWVVVALILAVSQKKIRESLFPVIKAFFAKKIIITYLLSVVYITLSVFLLYRVKFWDIPLLKKTVFWTLTFASVSLFNINKVSEDKKYFIAAVKHNLKLSLIFEFILDFYSPNLFVELLISKTHVNQGIISLLILNYPNYLIFLIIQFTEYNISF